MNVVHLVVLLASHLCFAVIGTPVNSGEYYEILELKRDATDDLIKRNYRRLAKQWHPDKHETNKQKAAEVFQKIREAYDVLSDPKKRMEYDNKVLKGEDYHGFRNERDTLRRENYNKNKGKPGGGSISQLDESLTIIFNTKRPNIGTNQSTGYRDEGQSRSNNQRPNTLESCYYHNHATVKTRVMTAQSFLGGSKITKTVMEMLLNDGKLQIVTVEEVVDSKGIKHVSCSVEVRNLRGSQKIRGVD